MKYSQVSGDSESNNNNNDSVSVASSRRRFRRGGVGNEELSQPLTDQQNSIDLESLGTDASDRDPYFVFRRDLQNKLEQVDESLADYLRIVHETDTAVNTHEYKDSKKQLKRHLKMAESTLRDVITTVQVVENDRDKFIHIDDGQLFERKALVDTSRERINKAREELSSEGVKLKLLEDERNKAIRRNGTLGATTATQRENTSFVMDNQAQTSLLMQQQDETLDELGEAVVRVGEMAGNIHEEIEMQNQMLDELDEDLTKVEEELGLVLGKLAKFLKTKNRCHLGTIMCLSLIVFILFFLILYT